MQNEYLACNERECLISVDIWHFLQLFQGLSRAISLQSAPCNGLFSKTDIQKLLWVENYLTHLFHKDLSMDYGLVSLPKKFYINKIPLVLNAHSLQTSGEYQIFFIDHRSSNVHRAGLYKS